MKNKIISVLVCLGMAASFTACGNSSAAVENSTSGTSTVAASEADSSTDNSEETAASSSSTDEEADTTPILDEEDYDLSECIVLGEYKGLKLTKTVEPVTDGDVLVSIVQSTGNAGEELTDKDAEVQAGDTANIDYAGKIDGVAFDGGTSTEPYDLLIGSGSFIDGFEDQLVGMKAGETKDIEVTFPDDYGSEDLNGKDAVFTVTVNSITRLDVTDDWVNETTSGAYTDADQYLKDQKESLEESNEETAVNNLRTDAWAKVEENSTFLAYPKSMIDEAEEEYEESTTAQATNYGYDDLDSFLDACGVTMDYYEQQKEAYGRTAAREHLILEALEEKENVKVGDDEYNENLDELSEQYNMDSDELIDAYGEMQVQDLILSTILVDRIISYADVTEA